MTMGPAPMIRMLSISARLGILGHQRDKPLEKVMAVLRAWTRLRVVLDREYRLADDSETFVGVVEQRPMGRLDPVRPALRIDDEAVVLAGDFHRPCQQILDRMIGAPVTALHLACRGAERQGQQLMAEANAKYRFSGSNKIAQNRYRVCPRRGRIARPIRQKDAIGPMTQNVLGRGGSGNHRDPAAMPRQHPQDIALGAVINGYDVVSRLSLLTVAAFAIPSRLGPFVGLATGHLLGEIHSLETGPIERLSLEMLYVDLRFRTMADPPVRGAPVADEPGQAAGIHPSNP